MKVMEALKPVFINGRIVEVGSKFSCSTEYAEKLVKSKSARYAIQEEKIDDYNEERKKLRAMTKEELLKMADEKGIEGLSAEKRKDEIIEALLKVVE